MNKDIYKHSRNSEVHIYLNFKDVFVLVCTCVLVRAVIKASSCCLVVRRVPVCRCFLILYCFSQINDDDDEKLHYKEQTRHTGLLTKSLTMSARCFLRIKPFNRPHFVGSS